MEQTAGHSAHEVRTWIAAYSALGAIGSYTVGFSYYRPIKEYIAGFGITTATPRLTRPATRKPFGSDSGIPRPHLKGHPNACHDTAARHPLVGDRAGPGWSSPHSTPTIPRSP
jgi:hypothetical protein